MSRSGYSEDCYGREDQWQLIRWRGAVASAIRGKRGQEFLRELADALDAMPVKELVDGELEHDGAVCALGAVGSQRGMDLGEIDPYEREQVAEKFGIAEALAAEIMYINDESVMAWGLPRSDADEMNRAMRERRWREVRQWVARQIDAAEMEGAA